MLTLRVFIALAALVVWALVLIVRGVRDTLAPFCAVCGTALYFTLFGCLGLLRMGGWVYYGAALAAAVWLCVRGFLKKRSLPRLSLGFWAFVALSVLALCLLAVRQPVFATWDEFSFWGTAAKLVKLSNELYTTAPIGWPWPATFPPGMTVFSYFFAFFGGGFAPWQVYAAADVLLLACAVAITSACGQRGRGLVLPVLLTALLAPFLFTIYRAPAFVAAPYLDSLGDVPMGMLFAATLAAWYAAAEETGWRRMLPVALGTAAVANTKDTGVAFALVAAALVLVDSLFVPGTAAAKKAVEAIPKRGTAVCQNPAAPGPGEQTGSTTETGTPKTQKASPRGFGARVLPALGRFGVLLAVTAVMYAGWALTMGLTSGADRTNLGGTQNVGMLQMPALFFAELFSGAPSAKFLEVVHGMPYNFLHWNTTMLGPGLYVAVAATGLAGVAALITKERAQRWRCLVFGAFAPLGFVAYNLLIAMSYIYMFRPEQTFESYERYLFPYYIAWFLAAVALLAQSARNSRFVVEGRALALAMSLVLLLRCAQFLPIGQTVVGFNTAEYAPERAISAEIGQAAAALPEDSLTFIVATDDDGSRWFRCCYEFLPRQVDYSFGGDSNNMQRKNTQFPPLTGPGTNQPVTCAEWQAYLAARGITHLYIDSADEAFRATYGAAFADDLRGYFESDVRLYCVTVQGGLATLAPFTPA